MARFNPARQRSAPRSTAVITGPIRPAGRTAQGATGYVRHEQSELFLLAVSNLVGKDTFYESGADRDSRYVNLIRRVAVSDPLWMAEFLGWLRLGANMRSAALVGGLEAAKAIAATPSPTTKSIVGVSPRRIAASVMQRADEPGEALGYWLSTYGRRVPKWLKRALGDAATRLYTPYTYLKWDSGRRGVRFADVIEFSQIRRSQGDDSGFFRYILDARPGARRGATEGDPGVHPMLAARAALMQVPEDQRRDLFLYGEAEEVFQRAGMTWEAVAGWLQSSMDGDVWSRLVGLGLLPYGALLRNLANLERNGVPHAVARQVIAQLTHAERIDRSRLMPMAFLTAYLNMNGDTFKDALDRAATYSLGNVPRFNGRTLILIDTSGSMSVLMPADHRSKGVSATRADAAILFGLALARACEQATVVSFAGGYSQPSKLFNLRPGENLLCAAARFRRHHVLGGGTDTAGAVRRWYAGHDRVVCLTDEQSSFGGLDVYGAVPDGTPVYTFNLAGYQHGHAPCSGRRYTVGGLNDAAFTMMAALDTYTLGRWPWQA